MHTHLRVPLTRIPAPIAEAGGWKLGPAAGGGGIAGVAGLGVGMLLLNVVLWKLGALLPREAGGGMHLGVLVVLGAVSAVSAWMVLRQGQTALFAPALGLTLDTPQLVRGMPATLRWTAVGDGGRLRGLCVSLVLSEECVYRRGTDHIHRCDEVRELVMADLDGPPASGSCVLLVPAEQPGSFVARSNQLLWSVRVRAEIRGAPTMTVTHPLVVAPGGVVQSRIAAEATPAGLHLPPGVLVMAAGTGMQGPGVPAPGVVVHGVVRAPGRAVQLRLRWVIDGHGDQEDGDAASARLAAGSSGFSVVLPGSPPAYRGQGLSITWILEATVDGAVVATQRFAAA